ncbi:deoxyribodipyrimidine photo-lyase [Sulfobacillus thermosulfidooxidans DSM 9293]|uniref:Deoxyribodipyrimidine photo-lyase n=1 Tax=Sulfobacillus thermosulfidooxidans (strain DSM 9293 / VKM B-1269 / AT-1) TaxID=929705 RepID=A0A1W1WDB4_SULTA|nr:deoxyribodipyrimidine photo-lyase [Sulfobacillus thermosulfidooxidans DSM 9293]
MIVLFRRDLRLADNPALYDARHGQVIPLYVFDDSLTPLNHPTASDWWLMQSLSALSSAFNDLGVSLILRRGPYARTIADLASSIGVDYVAWSEGIFPGEKAQDDALKHLLLKRGIHYRIYPANYLTPFQEVMTQQKTPYHLFTPFFSQIRSLLREQGIPPLVPAPTALRGFGVIPSERLASWHEEMAQAVSPQLVSYWKPGEIAQQKIWHAFVAHGLEQYHDSRDIYQPKNSSHLSAALHFGEISIRQILHDLAELYPLFRADQEIPAGVEHFFRELIWREFSAYLLYHFPFLTDVPADNDFTAFPWRHATKTLKAWQEGETGYPIVDAGMRQLKTMGFIPNRIRMIVASFLVKDLLISWTEGAKWFLDHLVDADLANNSVSWQWISGTGFDHAPFFRILNPITQSHKFDPNGQYIKSWLPELANLPLSLLHAPWQAPGDVLESFGVYLGENYPHRIVRHDQARTRALKAYNALKNSSSTSP